MVQAKVIRVWSFAGTLAGMVATAFFIIVMLLDDDRLCSVLLAGLEPGSTLLADRGYDADWIRAHASEHSAGANIPPKRNRREPICFSPYLYRARNLVERFFNTIKQCRRIATRYDNLVANYLAFVKLACIRLWLRACESTA